MPGDLDDYHRAMMQQEEHEHAVYGAYEDERTRIDMYVPAH